MDLPNTCFCGEVNMIDFLKLERRPLNSLMWVEGYECQHCRQWKPCWFSNRQLDEKLRKLESMPVTHRSFRYTFVKLYNRAVQLQIRGQETDGSIRHKDVAPA